jgi:hypothetical protein
MQPRSRGGQPLALANPAALKRNSERLIIAHALAINLDEARRFDAQCGLAVALAGTRVVHDRHFCGVDNHKPAALRFAVLDLQQGPDILNAEAFVRAGRVSPMKRPLAGLQGRQGRKIANAGTLRISGACHYTKNDGRARGRDAEDSHHLDV